MLHLDAADVARLLPPEAAIEAARDTARAVDAGAVHQAERIWHAPAGMPGQLGVMPSYLPDDGQDPALFITKLVGVFPAASPSVSGLITVQDATTGRPLATIDAAAVTAARTAAASGLATDLLARPAASTLAIIGAGVQGWSHLQAVRAVRPITSVRIWNRSPERAEAFAHRARDLAGITTAQVMTTARAATTDADIICVCTNSATPVLGAEDVAPGAHVTAIGAFSRDTRELTADLMARADHIVVDDRAAAAHEAGDILMAIAEGAIPADAVAADLAQLVSGAVTLERTTTDITVYKSVGTSAMDAVAVRHLLRADAARRMAAYGPLAPGEADHDVLASSGGRWQRGTVTVNPRVDGGDGYPGLVTGSAGPPVDVHVLTADGIDWAVVDAFEGPGYRRRRVVVQLGTGDPVVANTYVLTAP